MLYSKIIVSKDCIEKIIYQVKLNEYIKLLHEFNIKIIDIPLKEIQGNTSEISIEKCKYCTSLIKESFFIEDTCLGIITSLNYRYYLI